MKKVQHSNDRFGDVSWFSIAFIMCCLAWTELSSESRAADDPSPDTGAVTLRSFVPAQASVATVGINLRYEVADYPSIAGADRLTLIDFMLEEGEVVDLELSRFVIFDSDTKFVAGTPDGDRPLPTPEVSLFRGTVRGVAGSRAFLGISPHGTNGMVQLPHETYTIDSNRQVQTRGDFVDSVVQRLTAIARPEEGASRCAGVVLVPSKPDQHRSGDAPARIALGGSSFALVDVALDGDYGFYQNDMGSSSSAAIAYMVTLLANVSDVYESDLHTKLWLKYCRIWTADDPLGAGLTQFQNYWNDNMSVDRNQAHKITDTLGSGSGIALIDCRLDSLLCDADDSYAITRHNGATFANVSLTFAQELGHTCGSQHTHCYSPRIDTCFSGESPGNCSYSCFNGTTVQTTGTIMSYCNTATLDFHLTVISQLKNNIGNNGCLDVALSPAYVDVSNTGSEKGSSSKPWDTVKEGVRSVMPGGTVKIESGRYREDLTLASHVILKRWDSSGSVVIGN